MKRLLLILTIVLCLNAGVASAELTKSDINQIRQIINEAVAPINKEVSAIKVEIQGINIRMTEMEKRINIRFESIESKIKSVEDKFDSKFTIIQWFLATLAAITVAAIAIPQF